MYERPVPLLAVPNLMKYTVHDHIVPTQEGPQPNQNRLSPEHKNASHSMSVGLRRVRASEECGLLNLWNLSYFRKRCLYKVFGHFLFGFQCLLSCICCCLSDLLALSLLNPIIE